MIIAHAQAKETAVRLPFSGDTMTIEVSSLHRKEISLGEKYLRDSGAAYMNGTPGIKLGSRWRRRAAMRGSAFARPATSAATGDHRSAILWHAAVAAERATRQIRSRVTPGVNANLAGTELWGTQQANLGWQGKYDGVVGWWYGKGGGYGKPRSTASGTPKSPCRSALGVSALSFVESLATTSQLWNLEIGEQIAGLLAEVRRFGHVKLHSIHNVQRRWDALTVQLPVGTEARNFAPGVHSVPV